MNRFASRGEIADPCGLPRSRATCKISFWEAIGAISLYTGKYMASTTCEPSRLSEERPDVSLSFTDAVQLPIEAAGVVDP